ncbi:MAG: hypothetical protein JO277_03765, partial [Candidatus Eremiobacteraeota bacterium]|nr:hypothetical protein [Candidatus Eremiobacteraeota bacterium]
MKLTDSQRFWDQLGEADPMWTVLSVDEKFGGKWNADEFFATGVAATDELLREVEATGVAIN